VWAGFGGVRFTSPGVLALRQPAPLPQSTALHLRGLYFLGARLNVVARLTEWSVALSALSPSSAPSLKVVLDGGSELLLLPGDALRFPAGTNALVMKVE
jgi:hypothetical protein